MLRLIIFMLNRVNASLDNYVMKQDLKISESEAKLIVQKQDLMTAVKLAKKLEL